MISFIFVHCATDVIISHPTNIYSVPGCIIQDLWRQILYFNQALCLKYVGETITKKKKAADYYGGQNAHNFIFYYLRPNPYIWGRIFVCWRASSSLEAAQQHPWFQLLNGKSFQLSQLTNPPKHHQVSFGEKRKNKQTNKITTKNKPSATHIPEISWACLLSFMSPNLYTHTTLTFKHSS